MKLPSAHELLSVWEAGRVEPPYRQALLLLASAYPDATPEELAGLSIGRRDARLLTLRERLFGPRLESMAGCPACGDRLELTFATSEIRVGERERAGEALSLVVEGYLILFRLPDSSDMAALQTNDKGGEEGRLTLLKRCLTEVRLDGEERPAEELPAEVVDAVGRRMAMEDPQAEVKLSLQCPSCGHGWLAPFDILSFLWSEIERWAVSLLREVHLLARSYGWREADILAMTPLRRRSYMEMLGA